MNDTDFSWLAAKQKRLKTWREYAENETQDQAIKSRTLTLLGTFSDELNNIWESKKLSPEERFKLESLERDLEQLNEEARLRVVARG